MENAAREAEGKAGRVGERIQSLRMEQNLLRGWRNLREREEKECSRNPFDARWDPPTRVRDAEARRDAGGTTDGEGDEVLGGGSKY